MKIKSTFCPNPPSNPSGAFHSPQYVNARRCRAYHRPLLTVVPNSRTTSYDFAPPSRTATAIVVGKKDRHVESEMPQKVLIASHDRMVVPSSVVVNVDLIFVSQTYYPSVCVHNVTNDSLAPINRQGLPLGLLWAAWGCLGPSQGQPLGQPHILRGSPWGSAWQVLEIL